MTRHRHWLQGRPANCLCDKKKHPHEQAALEQAARDAGRYDAVVTVYRCPGSTSWHVSSTGFTPAGLQSYGRRLAYELLLHPGGVFLNDFRGRVLGLALEDTGWRRVGRYARRLVELGAARQRPAADGGRPTGWYELADERAARRIVQLGVDGFEEETRQAVRPS